ncbi:tRNA lysidine(34) synthetase TilS [Tessaracoccus sp. G1721]
MARRELGPAALKVAQAVAAMLPDGPAIVGCSGGADSTALALGARWASARAGTTVSAVVVDHGLQPGSREAAEAAAGRLTARGIDAAVIAVAVGGDHDGGLEAAARDARLAALARPGLPVMLGHTMDDQAETVLLGLLRGSGTRSLAGMAPVRGQFVRPLLGLRRADTEQACREWGVEVWADPMNEDPRFARVRARGVLGELSAALGRDVASSLARTATLARADADLLDALAAEAWPGSQDLRVSDLEPLPDALRWRVVHRWLRRHAPEAAMVHVTAALELVERWRGQGAVAVPGGRVSRCSGALVFLPGDGSGAADQGRAR